MSTDEHGNKRWKNYWSAMQKQKSEIVKTHVQNLLIQRYVHTHTYTYTYTYTYINKIYKQIKIFILSVT